MLSASMPRLDIFLNFGFGYLIVHTTTKKMITCPPALCIHCIVGLQYVWDMGHVMALYPTFVIKKHMYIYYTIQYLPQSSVEEHYG